MAFSDNGTFIAWDPLRPQRSPMCAACGSAGATSRCGRCRFAAYCSKECQQSGWAAHKTACAQGYSAYIRSLEEHTVRVGKLQLEGQRSRA